MRFAYLEIEKATGRVREQSMHRMSQSEFDSELFYMQRRDRDFFEYEALPAVDLVEPELLQAAE